MSTRSIKTAVVCTLVGSVLTLFVGQLAAASTDVVAGPPSSPPGQVDRGIELVDGLGSGGQPDGVPRELVIADARFLFDRVVPLSRQELFRVAQEQETIAYARTEEGPFAAIYLSVPNRSEDELVRYLPEGVGSAEVACPADAGDFERVDASGSLYAFAGVETDLTADSLQQVGDNNGEPVFADPDGAQPFPELFFSSSDGLLRFVLVGADGRPASIAESLAFDGTEFTFESDATDTVDRASLTKVGCSTAYPVFAPTETVDTGFTQLYVLAGTRLFSFTNAGAAPAQETDPPTTSTTSTTTTTTTPSTTGPPTTRAADDRAADDRAADDRAADDRAGHDNHHLHDDNGTADDHLDVDDDNNDNNGTADHDVDDNNDNGTADDHLDVDDNNDNGTADNHLDVDDHVDLHDDDGTGVDHLDVDDIDVDQLDDHDTGDYVDHHDDGAVGHRDNTVPRQPRRARRAGDPGAPADADPVRWRRLCLCRV